MKKIKFLILLVLVIILTGCKGEYNLTINNDLSISENVNLYIENKDDAYEKTLALFENNNIDDSKYNVSQNEEYVNIKYNEEFSNFEDYILNSKFYSRLFKNEDFKKNTKGMSYKGLANLKLDDNTDSSVLDNSYYITDLKINLKTPFVIKDSNADSIGDKTLSWIISEDDTFKNISFRLNYLKTNNLYIVLIALCLGIIFTTSGILIRNYLKERGI